MSKLDQLKAENPDLYKELVKEAQEAVRASIESEFSGREEKLLSEIGELTKSVDTLSGQVLDFQKKEAVRSEKEMKLVGETIWVKMLADSDIPDHLHEKVRLHVPYSRFVKDGILNENEFRDAIKAEIESWEKMGISRTVLGTGFNSDNVDETGNSDSEAARKAEDEKVTGDLLELAGQKTDQAA